MSAEILDFALWMAALGFPVFPLSPGGKTPLPGSRGVHDATSDTEQIKSWFSAYPGCNYGVATGNGLLVLDQDKSSGGLDFDVVLDSMADGIGFWSGETFKVRTPGGGTHRYMRACDVPNSAGKIAPGVDIRSLGGYVVGPGSFFSDADGKKGYSGYYEIEDDLPIARAPAELILRAGTKREREITPDVTVDDPVDIAEAIEYLKTAAPLSIEGQGGNDTAYRVAARLREKGCSPETSAEILAEYWNDRCVPPWDISEIEQFCRNAEAYSQNPAGYNAVTELARQGGVIDPVLLAGATVKEAPQETVSAPTAPTEPPPGAYYAQWLDLWHKCQIVPLSEIPEPEWVAGTMLQRGKVTFLAGPPGTGKSAYAIGLAVCGSEGKPFSGIAPQKPFKSLVYNGEDGRSDILKRAHGVCEANNIPFDSLKGRVGFVSSEDKRFKIVGALGELTAEAKELAKVMRDQDIALFVTDTFSRVHNLEENSSHLMSAVMESICDFATLANCAVLLTHHTAKRTGTGDGADAIRGASALVGSARAAFTLFPVDKQEAQAKGLDTGNGRRYIRLDEVKQNSAKGMEGSIWLEKTEQVLANGRSTVVHVQVNVSSSATGEAKLIADELANRMDAEARFNIRLLDGAKYLAESSTYLGDEDKSVQTYNRLKKKILDRFSGGSVSASNGDIVSTELRNGEYWISCRRPDAATMAGEWESVIPEE